MSNEYEDKKYTGPEVLKISHTTIATVLQCPRKYRYRYVDALEPVATPAAFAFGRAVHAAIAQAYARQNAPMTAEEVAGAFAQHFAVYERQGIRYNEKDTFEGLLAKGRVLVALWYEKNCDDIVNTRVLACEAHLSCDIDLGLILQGYADIIEERDGRLLIGDHKTVASWGESDEVATSQSIQFLVYAYLVWKKYDRIPDGMYVTILKKTKVPDVSPYYMQPPKLDDLRAFEDYVREVASIIRFYERENVTAKNIHRDCNWCAYSPLCFNVDGAAAMFKPREQRLHRDEQRKIAAADALVAGVDPKYDGDDQARKLAVAGAVVDYIAADDE